MAKGPLRVNSSVSLDQATHITLPLQKSRRTRTEPVPVKEVSIPIRQQTASSRYSFSNQNEQVNNRPFLSRNTGPRSHTPWFSSPITQRPRSREVSEKPDIDDSALYPQSKHSLLESEDNEPILSTRQGSSTIELLYDLFFTANLSQFTSDHAMDTKEGKTCHSSIP